MVTKKRLSYLILLQILTNSMFCVVNTQKEAIRMPKALLQSKQWSYIVFVQKLESRYEHRKKIIT